MSESIPPMQPATPIAQPASRAWEVLCHLSSIAGLWFTGGSIIGPLLVWAFKRNESLGVDAHGKESMNFHISWALYEVAAYILALVSIVGLVFFPVLIMISIIARVVMCFLVVVASIKASNGRLMRYPLTIRFLK